MSKLAVVAGVPGVGKTTVVEGALEGLKKAGAAYELVNYGDFMLKIARVKAGVNDRDDMRKLELKLSREIQEKAAKEIAKLAKKKPVLVDTHCTIKTPRGYLPGLPRWVLKRLNPSAIVLIEAEPQRIAGRRNRDDARSRDDELQDEIVTHQQLNRAAATVCAAMSGATVTIINNEEGKVNEAVNKMIEVLR